MGEPRSGRLIERTKTSDGILWRVQDVKQGDWWILADWTFFLEEGDGISFVGVDLLSLPSGPAAGRPVYKLPRTVSIEIPRHPEWICSQIIPKLYRTKSDEAEVRLRAEADSSHLPLGDWLDQVAEDTRFTRAKPERIFEWWTDHVLKRRIRHLYLEEKITTDIEEIIEDHLQYWRTNMAGYYKIIRADPLRVVTLRLEHALRLCSSFDFSYTDLDLTLAKVARFVYEYSIEGQHSCVPASILKKEVPSLESIWDLLTSQYDIIYVAQYESYYMRRHYEWEESLARSLIRLMAMKTPTSAVPIEFIRSDLNAEQITAVSTALNSPIVVITGGAGRGKTTITKEICHNLRRRKRNYAITAYTGAAVARAKDMTGDDDTDTILTAHLLRKKLVDPFDTLIVDESSMMVTWLLADLLELYDSTSCLILIGDINQLRPVSWGAVMRQVFAYNAMCPDRTIPVVRLLKNHRERGQILSFDANGRLAETERCHFIPGTEEAVISLFGKLLGDRYTTQDIAIITPYVESTKSMNERCQLVAIGTRAAQQLHDQTRGIKWIIGDRVVMKKNVRTGEYGVDLYNGAMGQVIDIDLRRKTVTVEFATKYNTQATFKLAPETYSPKKCLTTKFLKHAYAFTAHNGQGREWRIVIFFVPQRPKSERFFNFNLIYTAISRPRDQLYVVGDIMGFHRHFAIANTDPHENLARMIRDGVE